MTHAPHLIHAAIQLSGGNDQAPKDLQACTGECDSDAQCVAGLKCFQREHGETIPGCSGSGGGKQWDYCYKPGLQSLDYGTHKPKGCFSDGSHNSAINNFFFNNNSVGGSDQPGDKAICKQLPSAEPEWVPVFVAQRSSMDVQPTSAKDSCVRKASPSSHSPVSAH